MPFSPATGRRDCDVLAKAALGRAHSRVFLAPPRGVLSAGSYDGPLSSLLLSIGLSSTIEPSAGVAKMTFTCPVSGGLS